MSQVMKKPGALGVLAKYNFPCLSCPMFSYEMNLMKLGDVCQKYGIDSKKLLAELNEL